MSFLHSAFTEIFRNVSEWSSEHHCWNILAISKPPESKILEGLQVFRNVSEWSSEYYCWHILAIVKPLGAKILEMNGFEMCQNRVLNTFLKMHVM